MKNIFLNSIILLFSICIALLATEFIVRLAINPVNYLKPKLESDLILGHKIIADSGGHDSWGFRNASIPDKVNILAIGDSQTYGVMAPANESWPSILAQLTNKEVYNLSLGGYGPVQYLHLLKTKAKILSPEIVVVAVYLGNDFIDSYRIVYRNNNWIDFRLKDNKFQQGSEDNQVFDNYDSSIRAWLAHNSVLYRMITNSVIGDMVRLWETKKEVIQNNNDNFFTKIKSSNINTGFTPKLRLSGLDLSNVEVQEGLRISLSALKQMNEYTKENKVKFLVAIIPTKESVYATLLKKSSEFNNPVYNKLIDNESKSTEYIIDFLNDNKINYIEPLYAMRNAVVSRAIYPAGYDGHPNGSGYEVIAKEIFKYIETNFN
ncbi:MAG: hypothetical protein OEW87_04855 [Flavobacteriaceae bacterium]|nr:hypothetical protein [Flavobacteriaceae bacterium]